jgi:hypothetical protein
MPMNLYPMNRKGKYGRAEEKNIAINHYVQNPIYTNSCHV